MSDRILVLKSYYTFTEACASPEDLVRAGAQAGYRAVALCDRYGSHGWPEFSLAAQNAGILPIPGLLATTAAGDDMVLLGLGPGGVGRLNQIATRFAWSRRVEQGREVIERFEAKTGSTHFPGATCSDSWDIITDLLVDGWEDLAVICASISVAAYLTARCAGNVYIPSGMVDRGDPTSGVPSNLAEVAVDFADGVDEADRRVLEHIRSGCDSLRGPGGHRKGDGFPFDTIAARRLAGHDAKTAYEHARVLIERRGRTGSGSVLGSGDRTHPAFASPGNASGGEHATVAELRRLCDAGVRERYPNDCAGCSGRLEDELSVIENARLSWYFVAVHDIVTRFPRAMGRGSACASLVCYLLRITHVDPIEADLPFERFFSSRRSGSPDIDLDVPWDERHGLMDYVVRRYPGRAALVGDCLRFGPRTSVRYAATLLGYGAAEAGRFADIRAGDSGDLPSDVLDLARRIEGLPRSTGTHNAGVVVTPEPLLSYCSVWPSESGYPVLVWDTASVSRVGLVKLDCIGNRSLAALRDCLSLVSGNHGASAGWHDNRGLDDEQTIRMFARGDTIGVFYVESPATRQLLGKMQRGDYRHVVIATSIIRPSSYRTISEYLRRLHGGGRERGHEIYEAALEETLGIVVFQEDVQRIARELAGFGPDELDLLRRVVSKKEPVSRLESLKSAFFRGARERGIDGPTAIAAWDGIEDIVGYSFSKAHSSACALIAFRLGWLKCHFPAEFFASIINNGGGYYSRQVYIDEARRAGVEVLPPDVQESEAWYSASCGSMRVGLSQISGLSRESIDRIVSQRRELPFSDLRDFLVRCEPGPAELRALIRSGALDSVGNGLSRPRMFWIAGNLDSQSALFPIDPPDGVEDYSERTMIRDEREMLGVYVRMHPADALRAAIDWKLRRNDIRITASGDLPALHGAAVCLIGVPVAFKEAPTRSGRTMCFASFEDTDGVYESVLDPGTYAKYRSSVGAGVVFVVAGTVRVEYGVPMVHVERLLTLI